MMKVSELVGFKSYRAMLAYNTLMLGLKMLPAYMGQSYEEFFESIEKLPHADQQKVILSAAKLVPLDEAELCALVCFCKDANGVPFSDENLKNLKPDQLIEVIVAVCSEIAKIKVHFLGDAEKKN